MRKSKTGFSKKGRHTCVQLHARVVRVQAVSEGRVGAWGKLGGTGRGHLKVT